MFRLEKSSKQKCALLRTQKRKKGPSLLVHKGLSSEWHWVSYNSLILLSRTIDLDCIPFLLRVNNGGRGRV